MSLNNSGYIYYNEAFICEEAGYFKCEVGKLTPLKSGHFTHNNEKLAKVEEMYSAPDHKKFLIVRIEEHASIVYEWGEGAFETELEAKKMSITVSNKAKESLKKQIKKLQSRKKHLEEYIKNTKEELAR